MNKKGFTLVELLVTVAIAGLVIGFSAFGIIKVIDKSKSKAITLSEKNIMNAAITYSGETDSDNWKKNDTYPYEAYCVTVGELMNKGLLDKNANLTKGVTKDSIIIVNRNKVTYAIENQKIVKETDEDESGGYELCTNQVVNKSDVIEKNPKVTGYQSYTDEIRVPFEEGKVTNDGNEVPVNYSCAYGEDLASVNLSRQGRIEGNECIISGLKNNKSYVVMVYMNTEKGSIKKADGGLEYSTSDFKDVEIVPKGNTVTITYNDTNVREGNHYFKSTMDATVESNAQKCTLDKNIFKCGEQGTKIEKDTWYRTNSKSIKLTYSTDESIYKEGANKVTVTARITDPSNNYRENNKDFNINKYTITFNKNTAVRIDGKDDDEIKKSCVDIGDGCNITSPSIEATSGRSEVGWNTSRDGNSSTWNVNEEKKITGSATYYAITRDNVVRIKYSVNGGTIATPSNSGGTWSVNGDIVYHNESEEITTISYGSKMRSDGLNNYNNSTYINISKRGYHGVSGNEWVCLSGCSTSGKTFNQLIAYNANDFCDALNGDCTVTVGVNWEPNVYTIKYSSGGGTGSMAEQKCKYGETCTIKTNEFIRSSYKFNGWKDPEGNTTWTGWSGKWVYINGQYGIVDNTLTLTATWTSDVNSGGGGSSSGTNYCKTINPQKPYQKVTQENGKNWIYCCSSNGSNCEQVCTTDTSTGSLNCRCMAEFPSEPYITHTRNATTECCAYAEWAEENGKITGGSKYICSNLDLK